MNTRKALGIFTGRDHGDTFLSDPRAAAHFERMAAARQSEILRKQQEPAVSMPHARLALDKASEATRTALLDATSPLVDKFSAYQTAKKHASQVGADGGLRALAQHLRVQWESDPDGFFSAADLVRMREHFGKSFGRTAAVEVLSNAIPRVGVGDLPVRRLAQMATQIRTQADYEALCRRAGIDGSRPDQVRARAYLRALVRRAAEGDDVMQPDVNEQQGAQLSGIPADDGGGVLSGADPQVTQLHAQASLPSERQVTAAVLDANVVKLAGYSLFINDNDHVELRTPRGASREAPISKLGFVVRDFLKIAQGANFEPSVNEQQDPYVKIDETEGGDVIGKDSTSDESATDAIVPSGKPKAQHPMQSNSGTSRSEGDLGTDSAGDDPTWGNPALSGAHSSDPHSQSGTSFSERDLGPDRQQDTPEWESPGPIITSREARLDDSPFLVGSDPAERYRQARENRPSARLLEGIADESGWLARRVLAQFEETEEEVQTDDTDVVKEAARSTVRLRDDVFQIGDGFVDRTADSKLIYTFGYDQKLGQPHLLEMQRYVDTCCGGVRAYRVASVSQMSPGVVRAIVIEAQAEAAPMFGGDDGEGGFEEKREAVRRAMGKVVVGADFGNDAAGMGSDYEGTLLGKEGAEKMVPNPNPKGRSEMVTESYAKAWKAQQGGGTTPRYEEPALPPAPEWATQHSPYDKPDVLPTKKNLGAPSPEHEQRMQEYEQSKQQALTPKLGPGPEEPPRDDTALREELEQAGWTSPKSADAPEGWSGTVEEMIDKHPEIDNPFALANWMKDKGYESHEKESSVQPVRDVASPSGPHEGTQKAIKPVRDVPSLDPKGQPSQPKQGARISEGWGEGGEYKRDIEAENAQEVWELHRGLGGEAPDFAALQQQQQAQMSAPVEPRQDEGGQARLPEPEPETMNAQQQQMQQPAAPKK